MVTAGARTTAKPLLPPADPLNTPVFENMWANGHEWVGSGTVREPLCCTDRRVFERAQSLRSLAHGGRGRGQVPRRRLPGGAARRLRAVCGHGSAHPARGIEILERGAAGALRNRRGSAAPPPSRAGQINISGGRLAARLSTKIFYEAREAATAASTRRRKRSSSSISSATGSTRLRAASAASARLCEMRTKSFSVVTKERPAPSAPPTSAAACAAVKR